MVDPVGTPLAALATAQQCVQLAKLLREKYQDYRSAEQQINELALALESYTVKIEVQVTFLQSVWDSLEEKLQNIQNTLLHYLWHKLSYAIDLIDAAKSRSDRLGLARRDKFNFAISLKSNLQKAVDDLRTWHQMFDPTWYMISRVSNAVVEQSLLRHDTRLDNSVSVLKRLRRAALQQDGRKTLPLNCSSVVSSSIKSIHASSIRSAKLQTGDSVVISTFTQDTRAVADRVDDDVNKMAATLANVDPTTFGLLQCHGVLKRDGNESDKKLMANQQSLMLSKPRFTYDLIFLVPVGLSKPLTLRTYLNNTPVSLNTRLSLAQSLSNAVMYVHSSCFVHKNIRPETILNFRPLHRDIHNTNTTTIIPYLMGFEKFRTADGQTFRVGDSKGENDLYRHPKRQGLWPEEDYKMLHDIYSLGVVLLEVGIWTSFVIDDHPSPSSSSTTITTKEKGKSKGNWSSEFKPGPELTPIIEYLSNKDNRITATRIKDFLVKLATTKLPNCMGSKYAEVVVSCLTCLDADHPGLGDLDAFLDKDDINVGVEFVENVIVRLQEISL